MHYRDFRQDEEDGRMAAVSGSGGSGAGLIPACLAMLTLVSCLGMVIEYHTITQDDALLDPWEDQTVEGLRNRGSSHLESTLSDLETEVTAAKVFLPPRRTPCRKSLRCDSAAHANWPEIASLDLLIYCTLHYAGNTTSAAA